MNLPIPLPLWVTRWLPRWWQARRIARIMRNASDKQAQHRQERWWQKVRGEDSAP
jgi:hypothetical protein